MLSIILAIIISAVSPAALSYPSLPGAIQDGGEESRTYYGYGSEFSNPQEYSRNYNPERVFVPERPNPFSYPYFTYSNENPSLSSFDDYQELAGLTQKRIRSPQYPQFSYYNVMSGYTTTSEPVSYYQSVYSLGNIQPIVERLYNYLKINGNVNRGNLTDEFINNNRTINASSPLDLERGTQNYTFENVSTNGDTLKSAYSTPRLGASGLPQQYQRVLPWYFPLDSSSRSSAFLPGTNNQPEFNIYRNNLPMDNGDMSVKTVMNPTYTGGSILPSTRYLSPGSSSLYPGLSVVPPAASYQNQPFTRPSLTRFGLSEPVLPYNILAPYQRLDYAQPDYYPSILRSSQDMGYPDYRSAEDSVLGVLPIIKPRYKLVTTGSLVKTDEGGKYFKYDNKQFDTGFNFKTPTGHIYSNLHTSKGYDIEKFNKKGTISTGKHILLNPLASAGL